MNAMFMGHRLGSQEGRFIRASPLVESEERVSRMRLFDQRISGCTDRLAR